MGRYKTHAYMGPFPGPNANAEKLKEFLLTYHCTKPIASKKKADDKNNVKPDY